MASPVPIPVPVPVPAIFLEKRDATNKGIKIPTRRGIHSPRRTSS